VGLTEPGQNGESTACHSTHSGLASVDLLCHYVAIFPSLRPLTLVLKQFLYERGLSSTYTGGLNSYCLVLMLVAFLQSRPDAYRYYTQHTRQVHEQIQAQRSHHRQVMEHLGVVVGETELPPTPPLSRPSSSSQPSLSHMNAPSSPPPSAHRYSFTLSAQSPVFQPSASSTQPLPRSVPS
jgi:hypothetical protein